MDLLVKLFLYLCFLVVSKCQEWAIDDDGCRTPDGGVGSCIPVRQCQPMVNLLKTVKRPIPDDISKQLQKYYCSFRNNVPNVCCPPGPIILQDNNLQNQKPPDVSNHRNIRLLPDECGLIDISGDKIVNGENANLNEFPWMALISYGTATGRDFKCGATIINQRYILTAAHCITNLQSSILGVRVGEYNIKTRQDCITRRDKVTKCAPPVQDVGIEEIIPHPQFNATTIANDIGLLRIGRINLNVENVKPVCLPLGDARNNVLTDGVVTGWGISDVETGARSDILQKVRLDVVDTTRCKEVYKSQSKVQLTDKQICLGGKEGKDSCPGDSGGPLHETVIIKDEPRFVQQGIVSFGPRHCGLNGYPGVYTKVAYYMDWILDTIRP